MGLTREGIVRSALELLDEVGLDEFTTRRLAHKLGIRSPTLYWHFRSKRALLDAMAGAMLAAHDARPVPQAGDDWRTAWSENARSFRRALLAHRDGARVHAGTRPTSGQFPRAEAMMRLLRGADFAPLEALAISMALSRFVVGWVLEEQAAAARVGEDEPGLAPPPGHHPLLDEAFSHRASVGPDAMFGLCLDLMLRVQGSDGGRGRA